MNIKVICVIKSIGFVSNFLKCVRAWARFEWVEWHIKNTWSVELATSVVQSYDKRAMIWRLISEKKAYNCVNPEIFISLIYHYLTRVPKHPLSSCYSRVIWFYRQLLWPREQLLQVEVARADISVQIWSIGTDCLYVERFCISSCSSKFKKCLNEL